MACQALSTRAQVRTYRTHRRDFQRTHHVSTLLSTKKAETKFSGALDMEFFSPLAACSNLTELRIFQAAKTNHFWGGQAVCKRWEAMQAKRGLDMGELAAGLCELEREIAPTYQSYVDLRNGMLWLRAWSRFCDVFATLRKTIRCDSQCEPEHARERKQQGAVTHACKLSYYNFNFNLKFKFNL